MNCRTSNDIIYLQCWPKNKYNSLVKYYEACSTKSTNLKICIVMKTGWTLEFFFRTLSLIVLNPDTKNWCILLPHVLTAKFFCMTTQKEHLSHFLDTFSELHAHCVQIKYQNEYSSDKKNHSSALVCVNCKQHTICFTKYF